MLQTALPPFHGVVALLQHRPVAVNAVELQRKFHDHIAPSGGDAAELLYIIFDLRHSVGHSSIIHLLCPHRTQPLLIKGQ